MYKVNKMDRVTLNLSQEHDNDANGIQFDIGEWVNKFGPGTVTLTHKRKGDKIPYPVNLEVEDGIATWIISDVDTAVKGYGAAQLMYQPDDTEILAQSAVAKTLTLSSNYGIDSTPDSYENWLANLTDKAGQSLKNANDAKAAANSAKESADAATEAKKTAIENKNASEEAADFASKAAEAAEGSAKRADDKAAEAGEKADAAAQSKTDAETAARKAGNAQEATEQAKQATLDAKKVTVDAKNEIILQINGFAGKVNDAEQSIATKKTDALNTIGTKQTQAVNAVGSKQTEAVSAVETKKEEGVRAVQNMIDAIPEDFTDLQNEVSDVKKDLSSLGLVVENNMLCVEMEG